MNLERGTLAGPILILLGAVLLFRGGISFDSGSIFEHFWPTLFIIPLGVFFHWMYFSMLQRRGAGLLVPGASC